MPDTSPSAVKHRLRALVRGYGPPTPAEAEAIVSGLERWLSLRETSSILAYMPLPGEITLQPLVERLRRHRWLVTRTPPTGWLTIHRYDAPVEVHRFGFSQPVAGSAEIDPTEVDLAIVPGLAFDQTGMRLGRGVGYYDELLARLSPAVDVVGVTVDRLVLNRIPEEPHDVRVGWLATESGVRRLG